MQGNRSKRLILPFLREFSGNLNQDPTTPMEITYSTGPRYLDGINIDADANAGFPAYETERAIDEPVTGLTGRGYEPGQKNLDGSDL